MSRVEIAVVARAHGIRGELRLALHNPESRALDAAETLHIAGHDHAIESARSVAGGAVLVKLAGIDDRTTAEGLRGQAVLVDREELELEDDDVLLSELVGLRARLPDGTDWGEIVRIDLGLQSRLVVRDGDIERSLPIVDEFVLHIDIDAGTVTVDPPEGLPEDPA